MDPVTFMLNSFPRVLLAFSRRTLAEDELRAWKYRRHRPWRYVLAFLGVPFSVAWLFALAAAIFIAPDQPDEPFDSLSLAILGTLLTIVFCFSGFVAFCYWFANGIYLYRRQILARFRNEESRVQSR